MSDQPDLNDEELEDRLKILLDEDNEIKKWNEGLLIKSLILLPLIIFVIGLFVFNRPENLIEVLLICLYPLGLICMGLIILFVMTNSIK
tara:strand:+ start:216 stop:482 length:267 start_codon:yes stop_codon:yes gene_type:complete